LFGHLISALTGILKQAFPGIEVGIYGSFSTKLAMPWSDIDIVVQPTRPQPFDNDIFMKKLLKLLLSCQ
jgi:DNA polymerase sigma